MKPQKSFPQRYFSGAKAPGTEQNCYCPHCGVKFRQRVHLHRLETPRTRNGEAIIPCYDCEKMLLDAQEGTL